MIETIKKDHKAIKDLVPAGHKIGNPVPIFKEIKDSEAEAWKEQFKGKKQ